MGKMVKLPFNRFSIFGLIFSLIYTYLYLFNNSIFFKDVLNRINFLIDFNFENYLSNPIIFLKDLGDIFTAQLQLFLLNKGFIINFFYIFFITEFLMGILKNRSKKIEIISRIYIYSVLLIKPFAISFWDHHQFFLFFSILSNINFKKSIFERFFKYLFFGLVDFILIPSLIIVKAKTLFDSIILGIIFIIGLGYAYTLSSYNSISEPSTILSLISLFVIALNILIIILHKNHNIFNSYLWIVYLYIFLFFQSFLFGQNITNRIILNYSPLIPLLVFGREYIYDRD